MSNPNDTAKTKQYRSALNKLLTQFQAALDLEQRALRERDVSGLEHSVAEIQKLSSKLEQAAKHFSQLPARFAANDPRANHLSQDWQEIRNRLSQCSLSNRVIGGTVAINQAFTTKLLSIFRGGTSALGIYDATGRVSGNGLSQAITSA